MNHHALTLLAATALLAASCGDEECLCLEGTETGTSSTSGTDTDTSGTDSDTGGTESSGGQTTTTEPVPCTSDDECGGGTPFCGDAGECVDCSGMSDGDGACAELDANAPACNAAGECVACTTDNATACGGDTPICDGEAFTCVGCSFHEECQAVGMPACNLIAGNCIEGLVQVEANSPNSGSIQAILDSDFDTYAVDGQLAIVLSSGGGNHTITVADGRVVALVSADFDDTTPKAIRGDGGAPTLTVDGDGTTVFLHRVSLLGNLNDYGILASNSAQLFADSTQVSQNSGGGISLTSGAQGHLRNCMVGATAGANVIEVADSNLDMLYTSVGSGYFAGGGLALSCSGTSEVDARNAIVLGLGVPGGEAVVCDGATFTTSAGNLVLDGTGNVAVGDSGNDNDIEVSWFEGYTNGNLSLTEAGATIFADIAQWTEGDPTFDIDNESREEADYPGADVP